MADSNALGSNQPDVFVEQEIFGVESDPRTGDTGQDYMSIPDHVGVEMLGVPQGITQADIMQGMAEPEQFHDGNDIIGVYSDDGAMIGDVAASAHFSIVGGDPVASGEPVTHSIPMPSFGDGGQQQGSANPSDGPTWVDF